MERTWIFTRTTACEGLFNREYEREQVKLRANFNTSSEAISFTKETLGWSNPPKWKFWLPRYTFTIEVEPEGSELRPLLKLEPDVQALIGALQWIAVVNATDYEYQQIAKKTLNQQGIRLSLEAARQYDTEIKQPELQQTKLKYE